MGTPDFKILPKAATQARLSRKGNVYRGFDGLRADLAPLGREAVLDGEPVCWPCFYARSRLECPIQPVCSTAD